jgi:hypothetical protein
MPSSEKEDTHPPSYHDSTHPYRLTGQTLLSQLSTTRTTHIHSIITAHILPLVEQQASYGIAQTTLALLPSDIPLPAIEEKSEFSFSTTSSTPVEVIGFSSGEAPKVVPLEGLMNRTSFWRVQAVVEVLESALREELNKSSYLRSAESPIRKASPEQQPRRTFLSRMVPSLGPEESSPSGNPEVGTRALEIDRNSGLVLVRARLEEISLRTVNEFGLYDTMSIQCVIVRVDARC